MKVDIYVHGVPNGQRIWGTGGDDQVINQFYGAGGEEQTKFLAEVRKSGIQNYCYYSILKYKNVSAIDGRGGSYFGLTIRMDMVCVKIKTMFQILDMVYNIAVHTKFFKKEGERLQFIVGDFKDKENFCKVIVDKIVTILGQGIDGNDFIAITGSMLNNKGVLKFNSSEYSSESALTCIRQNCAIAVSTEYPSSQFASYIKKKDIEISNIRLQCQQDISKIQKQATLEKQEQEKKSQIALHQMREQTDKEIEQIKAKYSDVDKKIQNYNQQIKQMQRDNNDLQKQVKHLHQEVQEHENTIVKLRHSSDSINPTTSSHSRKSGTYVFTTRILPFVNLLIVIVILFVVFFQMPSDNSKKVEQISNDLTELKESLSPHDVESSTTETISDEGQKSEIDSKLAPKGNTPQKTPTRKIPSITSKKVDKAQEMFEKAKAEASKSKASEVPKEEIKQ